MLKEELEFFFKKNKLKKKSPLMLTFKIHDPIMSL
jgi:hypothetical protein